MAAPLPDDTALDMLSFALSGPGVAAVAAFLIGGVAVTFSVAEVGPRRSGVSQRSAFLLRVDLPSPVRVELSNGTVKSLREGETVLQLHSLEACTAAARALERPGVSYTIYRADASGLRTYTTYPKEINAKGGSWPRGFLRDSEDATPDARWEEYQRLGATDDIDEEWVKMMSGLSFIQVSNDKECKLCGGLRTVRCHRCGGVGTRGGQYTCDCSDGRRPCEWCCRA